MKFVYVIVCSLLVINESFASPVPVKDVEADDTINYSEEGRNQQELVPEKGTFILSGFGSSRGLENSTSEEVDDFDTVNKAREEEVPGENNVHVLFQEEEQDTMKGKIRGVRRDRKEKRDLHWYNGGSGKGKGGSSSYYERYRRSGKGKGSRSYSSSSDDGYYYSGRYHEHAVPSKGSTYYPAKGSTYYPAKGSTSYSSKGSTSYSSKGSSHSPSKGGSKGATFNSKGAW